MSIKYGTLAAAQLISKSDENVYILPDHSVSLTNSVTLRRRLPKVTGKGVTAETSPLAFAARRDKSFVVGDTKKTCSLTINTVVHAGVDATAVKAWVAAEITLLAVEVAKGVVTGDICLDDAV